MSTDTEINFGKVAVLMGGSSGERKISLKSGAAVLAALQANAIDAHGVDVSKNVFSKLQEQNFDRAFIALHGCGGEDGTMQGGLEIIGVPYTGSGVMASGICMDKLMTKRVWSAESINSPRFICVQTDTDYQHIVDTLGAPFIVKPSLEGSSLGINKIESQTDYIAACADAVKYKGDLLAEQWIDGAEYTVGMLNNVPLPVIRLETPRGFYDFEAKYQSDDTQYILPCGLSKTDEEKIQQEALAAFRATGATGWGRVDVMVDKAGQPWFLEVNTVPGMTDHSLVPMAAQHAGIEFKQLVVEILKSSLID